MAETDNLDLEHLRQIRVQLDRVENRTEDITLRLGHVERSTAKHAVQMAKANSRLDRLEAGITRIGKRLDLVES